MNEENQDVGKILAAIKEVINQTGPAVEQGWEIAVQAKRTEASVDLIVAFLIVVGLGAAVRSFFGKWKEAGQYSKQRDTWGLACAGSCGMLFFALLVVMDGLPETASKFLYPEFYAAKELLGAIR